MGADASSRNEQEPEPPRRGFLRRTFGLEPKIYYFLKTTNAVENDGARRMLAKAGALSAWAFIATAGLGASRS
jgi:hypothetical protein